MVVEHTFADAGEYPVVASIDGAAERLRRDDRAHAVAKVSTGIRVLLVDGDPGADRFEGEADFLATALAPAWDRFPPEWRSSSARAR